LRRLALADATEETIRRLIEHGEDLLVERKRELPEPAKFGATVASFANTIGGWILLGINDDGSIAGYQIEPALDLQSHLGHLLRNEVEPVPPFATAVHNIDGASVGVVRVFESEDSPVLVRRTGAIYVRDAGGKQPLKDHRSLLELARRGERAREQASARLVGEELVNEVLLAPDGHGYENRTTRPSADAVRIVVRVAPLTITPYFADWPMSRHAAEECGAAAVALVGGTHDGIPPETHPVEPHGRAVVGSAKLPWGSRARGLCDTATVVAHSAGVAGTAITRAKRGGNLMMLDTLVTEEIRPILDRLATMLTFAEAYGRALCDVWLVFPTDVEIYRALRNAPTQTHVSGEVVIPADTDEITALTDKWRREIERIVGISAFEPIH
jgi:hypothetical protein